MDLLNVFFIRLGNLIKIGNKMLVVVLKSAVAESVNDC